jgi:NAD(P)-dependent dehydrogenase (short-subunit alcohol dehydrogenase family)
MKEKGKSKMSTILVTGATGTLGREVVQQLLQCQQHVRASTHQSHPSVTQGVEVYQGDFRVGSGLIEAMRLKQLAPRAPAPSPQVGGEVGLPKSSHTLHGTKIKKETRL